MHKKIDRAELLEFASRITTSAELANVFQALERQRKMILEEQQKQNPN